MWIKFFFYKEILKRGYSFIFLVKKQIRSDNKSIKVIVHNKTNVIVIKEFVAKYYPDGSLAVDSI